MEKREEKPYAEGQINWNEPRKGVFGKGLWDRNDLNQGGQSREIAIKKEKRRAARGKEASTRSQARQSRGDCASKRRAARQKHRLEHQ